MFPLEAGTLGKVSLKVVSLPLDAATLGKVEMTFHSEWPSDRNDLPLEIRQKSADLRFGVLEPSVGEARGEVYLPPTPLRPGAGHRRVTNSSEGFD